MASSTTPDIFPLSVIVTPGGSDPCTTSYTRFCPAAVSVSVATMSYSMYEPSSTVTFPVVSAVDNVLSVVDELSVVYTVDNGLFNCPATVVNDGASAPDTSNVNDLSVIADPAVARTTKV